VIVYCQHCARQTTTLEANARRFRYGRCGYCGGPLSDRAENDEKGPAVASPFDRPSTTKS
jgi:hypothetical protein